MSIAAFVRVVYSRYLLKRIITGTYIIEKLKRSSRAYEVKKQGKKYSAFNTLV